MRYARGLLLLIVPLLIAGCFMISSNPVSQLLEGKRAGVFVFLAPDCPLSQNYTSTLNELRNQFMAAGIEFFGVFAGPFATEGSEEFVTTYKIGFPVEKDSDFRITDFFGATTTPQAFVVDATGHTLYDGAIDNRAPELGQFRTVITENYLRDALQSVIDEKDVAIRKTTPVGCFIERPDPS